MAAWCARLEAGDLADKDAHWKITGSLSSPVSLEERTIARTRVHLVPGVEDLLGKERGRPEGEGDEPPELPLILKLDGASNEWAKLACWRGRSAKRAEQRRPERPLQSIEFQTHWIRVRKHEAH